jgi:hypothetical protein
MAQSPFILHSQSGQQFLMPSVDMWITLRFAPSFPHIHCFYEHGVEGTSVLCDSGDISTLG